MGRRLTQRDDVRDWQTLRQLLRTHSLVTTRLPLDDGRVIEVRKASRPDAEQALVYQRLGIDWKQACPARKFVMKSNRNETEMKPTLSCLLNRIPVNTKATAS
jgi:hypothetical protein